MTTREKGQSGSFECRLNNRLYYITASPVYTVDEITGVVYVMKDITELKKLREQLFQAERLASIGGLVSGVAHEINNPLTGVMGYAQLLTPMVTDEKQRGYLKKVSDSAERCKSIIENLQAFARQRPNKKENAYLHDAVKKTIELRAYWHRRRKITVENRIASTPKVAFDFQQIQQVILHIIVNAEEAILSQAQEGDIVFDWRVDEQWIYIFITNSGPNIPYDIMNRIFDPFFTTKDVGQGAGLGLSIAYGIMQDHGGHLLVDNLLGDGVCVTLQFPLVFR
jgi:two-component system NtrC family sensor kinase